jgi:thioesterase domain-containing protein
VFRYEPGTWQGSAQLFRVARQPLTAVPSRTLGWEHLIGGAVEVYDVGGTHATLMRAPFAEQLAAALNAALDKLDAKTRSADDYARLR